MMTYLFVPLSIPVHYSCIYWVLARPGWSACIEIARGAGQLFSCAVYHSQLAAADIAPWTCALESSVPA
jgi:hypothetical protein